MEALRVSFVPHFSVDRVLVLAGALAQLGLAPEIVLTGHDIPPKLPEGVKALRLRPGMREGLDALAWISRDPPDVLVVEAGSGSAMVLAAHALAGRPCPVLLAAPRSVDGLWARLGQRADRVVTHSTPAAAEIARLCPHSRIEIVPLPVVGADFARRMREPAEHCWLDRWTVPVILASGRLSGADDFPTLLRAASRMGARVLILDEEDGKDGAGNRHLRQLARALDVRLDVLDHIGDSLPFLARAPVFASIATGGVVPETLIEAMACGCAVAAAWAPGIAELLEGGRLAPLVPKGDDAALAASLAALLARPPDPEPLKRKAAEHSVEAGANAYARLLGEMRACDLANMHS